MASFSEACSYIESLPPLDSPDLFGMTDGAEKTYSESLADELTDTLARAQPNLALALSGYTYKPNLVFFLSSSSKVRLKLNSCCVAGR
jgi:hypothetical protein